MASRGREDPHRTKEAGYVRSGIPTVCLDYKELRKGEPVWAVMRDQESRVTTAHVAACKGVEDRWMAQRLAGDIEGMGYAKVTLKTDVVSCSGGLRGGPFLFWGSF